jgi:hypothetical protein
MIKIPLDWELYPNLVRIIIEGNGSCFFNAITEAYFIPYRSQFSHQQKVEFISNLRHDLSIKLPKHYHYLSRGTLAEFSKGYPDYSLENMQKELDSSHPVDSVYHEYVSNILNKDIYILEFTTKNIYYLGDIELYYKFRPSIVLLHLNDHYDLIGLRSETNNEDLITHFDPSHKFIHKLLDLMIDASK